MRLSSTVCNSSCCSFSFECSFCGRQHLTSKPIPPGQRTASYWPDKSGYNPGKSITLDNQSRQILDNNEGGRSYSSTAELPLDATADMTENEAFVVLDSAITDSNSLESGEDLARAFTYNDRPDHYPYQIDDND